MKYTCTFRDDVDQQVWSGKGDTRASHKAVIFVCLQECFRHIKIDGCVVDEFFQNLYSVLFRERRVDPRPDAVCMHACMHACEEMGGIPSPALAGNLSVSYESWFCIYTAVKCRENRRL